MLSCGFSRLELVRLQACDEQRRLFHIQHKINVKTKREYIRLKYLKPLLMNQTRIPTSTFFGHSLLALPGDFAMPALGIRFQDSILAQIAEEFQL